MDFQCGLGQATIGFAGLSTKSVGHVLNHVAVAERPEPPILVLRDVVASRRLNCLYTAGGVCIEASRQAYAEPHVFFPAALREKVDAHDARRCPPTLEIPAGLPMHREPVFLLGRFINHYGHSLTDSMARLWALPRVPAAMKILCLAAKADKAGPPIMRAVLRNLGIPEDRLIVAPDTTRFAEVICPLPAMQWSLLVYPNFDQPHRRVAAQLGAGDPALDRPVYLSRRGLGAGHRTIVGEEELETRLEREGYLVVRPERLSLADQVRIFQSDHPVIGVLGSALHTLLFRTTGPGKRIGVLTDDEVQGRFLLADAVKGTQASYFRALDLMEGQNNTPLQERTMRFDVSRTMEMLDSAGFLGGPPAAPTGRTRPEILRVLRTPLSGLTLVLVRQKHNLKIMSFEQIGPWDRIKVRSEEDGLWDALVMDRSIDPKKGILLRVLVMRQLAAPERMAQPVS